MDELYRQFVQPGDLAFDIGAHVGDRIASFRRLGARVVAVEPQPALARLLRLIYGCRPGVVIEQLAVGSKTGTVSLMLNLDNPTVATASSDFVQAAHGAQGWEDQVWTASVPVAVTTLDALIARHGVPDFIKIDVEGFEGEALAGLSHPSAALSYEFTTIQREVAHRCLERCVALGYARFNAALGESQRLVHAAWLDSAGMAAWLATLPHEANSGDIYARHA